MNLHKNLVNSTFLLIIIRSRNIFKSAILQSNEFVKRKVRCYLFYQMRRDSVMNHYVSNKYQSVSVNLTKFLCRNLCAALNLQISVNLTKYFKYVFRDIYFFLNWYDLTKFFLRFWKTHPTPCLFLNMIKLKSKTLISIQTL